MKKIVLVILGLFLFTMGSMYMRKKTLKEEYVLRFALPVDVPSLDVNSRGHDVYADPIMNLLFEGLMRKGENGIPQPAIAYKVDISKDQKKYTFYLRNCQWSDGVDVTAHDFEYSWKRAINPNSKYVSQVPYYFYSIKNARPCLLEKGAIEDVAIKALDDKTLEVELEYPDHYFLDLVSCSFYFPTPKHIVEKDPEWASKTNLICNGPFLLNTWKRTYCLQLEKNPHYWNKDYISFSGVEVSIIASDLTTLQMFEKGKLDWWGDPFSRISCDLYRSFQEKNILHKKEGNSICWLFLNTEKYPLNNKKLRQALSYAIDRDSLIENVFYGFGSPARGILSPPLRVTNIPYFEDNIEKARELFQETLDELGINKEKFPELEFSCVADSDLHRRVSQAIQDQWRKNLGIKITIKGSEWASYYSDVSYGNYEIGLMGWRIPCPNPNYIFEVFERKEDIINKAFWENKEFQDTIKQMRNALVEIERVKFTSKAEGILMEEMPVIPLAFLEQVFAKNPKLKGEILTSFPPIDFTSAYFEK